MMMRTFYVFLGVFFLTTNVYANINSELNLDGNKYEALKKLFDESKTPAQMTDFDMYRQPETLKCIFVLEKSPDTSHPFNVIRFEKHFPADGPLFPGKTVVKLMAYGVLYTNPETFYDFVSLSETATELVLDIGEHPQTEGYPLHLLLRKNGSMLPFSIIANYGKPEALNAMGYCYPKQ